jgi:DNA-binding transcriptional MerR regulator
MPNYKNQDIQALFNIAADTVRVWSDEFSKYLSPLATPESGKHRVYNDEDLKVFALVSEMRDKKMGYEEIHAALQNGQRGDVPEIASTRAIEYRAEQQLQLAQHTIAELREQLSLAEARQQNLHDENIKLQADADNARSRIDELTAERNEYQDEIKQLQREIGRLEAHLEIEKERNKKDE